MKKLIKPGFIVLLLITALLLLYVAGIIVLNTIRDYKPISGNLQVMPPLEHIDNVSCDTFAILIWNIGYAGLGKNADFFYDGGGMVRSPEEDFYNYFSGILQKLNSLKHVDFILLQEVDIDSKRSYGINQYQELKKSLPAHYSSFAINYDVFYVPIPFLNPMGKVISGIALFSRHPATSSRQVVFQGNYSWPKSLFMPDRCFIVSEFSLNSGQKLNIINTHNSAFDDGSLRENQTELLYRHMLDAANRDFYVICGGDWNMNPVDFSEQSIITGDASFSLAGMHRIRGPESEWNLVFDKLRPSNREVSAAYTHGQTLTTIIDYFVCSPRIEIVGIKCLYDGFEFSDHHPVLLQFTLKPGLDK